MKYFFVRGKKKLCSILFIAIILLCFSTSGTIVSNAESSDNSGEYLSNTKAIYQVNPLYFGEVSLEDLYHGPEVKVTKDEAIKAANKATSADEVAAQLRAALKTRTRNINIAYSFSGTSYNSSALVSLEDVIFNKAVAHTGRGDEGDYLKWGYSGRGMQVSYSYSSGNTIGFFTYNMTYYTSAAQEQSVTARVSQISSNLGLQYKGEYDKVLSLYEYVCNNVKYDYGKSAIKYTCYAACVNNSAVCQGYALLVYRVLNDAGISCRMIAGNTNSGQHGWNIVRVGGRYYNIDSTWDAGKNKAQYSYFMKSDADFSDHSRWSEYSSTEFYNTYPMSASSYDTGDVGSGNVRSVKLDNDKLTVKAGSSSTLAVKVNPDKASSKLSWESSDEDIATVNSSGKVKGVSPGTCKITVSSPDGKKKDSCYVTVTGSKSAVKSLKLNKKKVKLSKGKKFKLVITIKPTSAKNTSLVWKSSNSKVAKISKKGVIKAKGKGKCTITVTTKDGKKKATCKVTVK